MALETGDFVNDLVISNPPGTDGVSEGDDHIRLLKKVVKATFPSADSAFPLRWSGGVWTSGATGGDKGADTLNASNYYRDGVLLAGGEWFESSEQTITPAAFLTLAHGLGAMPKTFVAIIVNKTAEFGHAVGDRLVIGYGTTGDYGVQIAANATNLYISVISLSIRIGTRSVGASTSITNASWRLIGVAVL